MKKLLTGADAQNQRIVNLASGSNPTDAVNLSQLQAAINGISWHAAVRAASTTNITISSPGSTIDGVAMAVGDRFLAKDQSTSSEKGVYVWNGASTAATRAADGTQGNLNAGAAFYVNEGSVNADTSWTLTTDGTITVGTTALTFAKFGGGTAYTAGAGLTLSGTTFAVDTTIVARKYAANVGDGTNTSITVAHNLGTLDTITALYIAATGELVETDVTRTSTNAVTFTFPSAPAAGTYRCSVMG